jgi:hypothetical protein
MKKQLPFLAALLMTLVIIGFIGPTAAYSTIVVNTLEDIEVPPAGTVSIRSALASAADGETIVFHGSLDGGTIELSIIGDHHTELKGEVMGMKDTPSGPVSYLVGYFPRDYGQSALYAQKDVVIDASALPSGITLAWVGGYENPARVLAVYGDLTMTNVSITGGKSVAEELPPPDPDDDHGQLSTRARGAGVAVWGVARLVDCMLYDNHCSRESTVPARSRDAGAFGGGIYADIVDMENCVVSGNSVDASGVSGGGVFSVGGAEAVVNGSRIVRSTITGNGISGLFAYGGGVYSDGGGIGNQKHLILRNCTIARNLVSFSAPVPFGYWRGGGVYMSNGYLYVRSCTVIENQVHGVPRTDSLGKPNLAGGIAATIGNAHAVERMSIGHSVIAGNTVHPFGGASYEHDIFTGTLLHFRSMGYNRIGTIDFSQILVPVGQWASLCRRHYPKEGDEGGVQLADVINLSSGIAQSETILSAGVDAPNPVVLYYKPKGSALDQVPRWAYSINEMYGEYSVKAGATNNFLEIILQRIEDEYGLNTPTSDFSDDFTDDFEYFLEYEVDIDDDTPGLQPYTDPDGVPIITLAATQWFGPAETWPKELPNYPYIEFWHRLDAALHAEDIPGMGPELLGDDAWSELFSPGVLVENPDIRMFGWTDGFDVVLEDVDQNGTQRPVNRLGDIGAIEFNGVVPDIKANGSDGPVNLTVGDTLSITLELDPRNHLGDEADWWCVIDTPFGWFSYDHGTGGWLRGIRVSHQGPLGEVSPPLEVLSITDLPMGSYTFRFGVDGNRNGKIDGPLYLDSVDVTMASPLDMSQTF